MFFYQNLMDPNFVGTNTFDPNVLDPNFFWTNTFWPNFFGPKIFLDPKFFWTKNFFWTHNFFNPKFFLNPNFFLNQQFFWTIFFSLTQHVFQTKIFFLTQNFFWPKMNFNENDLWRNNTELLNLRLCKLPITKVYLNWSLTLKTKSCFTSTWYEFGISLFDFFLRKQAVAFLCPISVKMIK